MDKYVQKILPRFRYGDIAPRGRSGRTVMRGLSYDFYRIVPNDVMVFTTVMGLAEFDRTSVEKAVERYETCVQALLAEKVDCIILGGVPVSAQLGRERVVKLLRETAEKTGVRCDAPFESLFAAMKRLGLRMIAVASRWVEDVNGGVKAYIEAGGFKVVAMTTRGQWGVDSAAMSLEGGA